MGDTEYFFTTK